MRQKNRLFLSRDTMPKRLKIDQFIKQASEIHNNQYDYSKIKHVYAQKKIPIICTKHGEFQQTPSKHMIGQGCRLCFYERNADKCRSTQAEFIKKAVSIHGNKYDYSQIVYKNNLTKVQILCPEHGPFSQTPGNHTHKTNPQGCPACGGRTYWTTERFIAEAKQVHGRKYDYKKVICTDSVTVVSIICPEHGEFLQDAQHHIIRKQGCRQCGGTVKKTTEEFIRKAQRVHGDKYDYSESLYETTHKKVRIICRHHGPFLQSPANHTHKTNPQGCPKCTGRIPWTKERFLSEAQLVHPNKYNYDQVDWMGHKHLVTIICPYHGEFQQLPSVHLTGCGCRKCSSPKGETIIRELLSQRQIEFEEQASFQDCKDKNTLPFDFMILSGGKRRLIEYHGAQHYRPVSFGGKKMTQSNLLENFKTVREHDEIKQNWCVENSIPLLVIPDTKSESEIAQLVDNFISNEIEAKIKT